MTSTDSAAPGEQTPATQLATRVIFFIAGLGMSAWAPLVPYAKTRIGLSDASLGALLLSLGFGSLVAMPLTGKLAAKYGCKALIVIASLTVMLVLPLLATLPTAIALAVTLMIFGAAIGVLDVAMNIQAVEVEKAAGRAMMSGFHGFFSIGGIAGAGLVSALLWAGLLPLQAVLMVAVLIFLLLLSSQKHLLSQRLHQPDTPLLVLPRGWVLFLGILCFILFLTEGAILDWSALFLTNSRDLPASQAGLGYAVFSVAMTIGRLTGDRTVSRFGSTTILLCGSLGAAAGIFLAVSINDVTVTLLALFLVGLGASNTVPILFSAAGKQDIMPVNLAISAMTTIGYAGILAGPALVGFVSQWFSLTTAFTAIAVLLLAVAASARLVTR
ncbi:MFS transporter [Erwiniaceae bacterium BAC15a-03b]|uniref:MFS transporter n=1 Tax=Winslowiella arboricola TaxID=2978220 RepID=A0A9J6PPN1_9GAMM|nr:MFS transporter [Winslowiella arboricola]MCU5773119.1 MFS transporter [Winslowiella arboricola]MCU5778702.1 MFS transporter [Winslowiella arboricola]